MNRRRFTDMFISEYSNFARTVTAHAIGLTIKRENAAQVLVMTTKQEIKRCYDEFHTDLLRCATFLCTLA